MPIANNSSQPSKIVCILGMHRSGTSALTGSLQQYGLELGKYHTWNRHNIKGNRENQDIVDLHNDILKANAACWDRPSDDPTWTEAHVARARRILTEYSRVTHWGFKDPRTLLFLDFWEEVCSNLDHVGIFRHPVAVAKSLNDRNKMPLAQGLRLWYQYNSRLLKLYNHQRFPIVDFDQSPLEFEQSIGSLARALDLPQAGNPASQFYSDALRHHEPAKHYALPVKVWWLYRRLRRISRRRSAPSRDFLPLRT